MADEYQLRKDIDELKLKVESVGITTNEAYNKAVDKLDVDLGVLYDDLTVFSGTLVGLKGSLIDFNAELISFDEDNNNLATDLDKLRDNLHLFLEAVNTLSSDVSDLDDSLTNLDEDLFGEEGLDSVLTALSVVVGDNNSGLVKGLNDLDANLTSLDNQVFGNNGLDDQLTNLAVVIGDNNSGLVKGLSDLEGNLNSLDNSVFGSNGLSSNVTRLSNTIGNNNSGLVKELNDLSGSVTSLDNSVFGNNGLSSRLSTVETSLSNVSNGLTSTDTDLKKLVYSLDKLSDYLTSFEGSLEELEDELEADPNIDTSKLNSNIVALFGAIGEVKNNVSTVETDMYGTGSSSNPSSGSLLSEMSTAKSNITSANNSINNVKTDLYGANGTASNPANNSLKKNLQTVQTTVGNSNSGLVKELNDTSSSINNVENDLYGANGTASNPANNSLKKNLNTLKNTTVPAVETALYGDGTASNPSANSTMGKVNAVKTELYGSNGTAAQPADGSLKKNLVTLKDTTVPAVSNTATAAQTAVNTVKTDLYGTGTANNPQSGSVKANINKVKNTDIPAVQNIIYGNGTESNPEEGSLLDTVDKVDTGITTAKGHIDTIQTKMYKGENGTGTINNPANGTVMKQTNTAITQIGDSNSGLIKDINVAKSDIQTVRNTANTANTTANAAQTTANTANTNANNAHTKIGNVNVNTDGNLQTQITNLPSNYEKLWVCLTNSTTEISKMSEKGNARIGVKISSLGLKMVRDYPNGVHVPLRIVSPSGGVVTPYSDALVTSNGWSNGVLYFTYNFSEFGVYKIFCEDLTYTFQVGEGVSDFVLKGSSSMFGLSVKVYSDGLSVFVTVNGTLNGSSSLPSGGSRAKLGNLFGTDELSGGSPYAPFHEMQCLVHSSVNFCRLTLYENGALYLQNGNSSKSFDLKGSFYYPLKRRFP